MHANNKWLTSYVNRSSCEAGLSLDECARSLFNGTRGASAAST